VQTYLEAQADRERKSEYDDEPGQRVEQECTAGLNWSSLSPSDIDLCISVVLASRLRT